MNDDKFLDNYLSNLDELESDEFVPVSDENIFGDTSTQISTIDTDQNVSNLLENQITIPENKNNTDILSELLKEKGISDPTQINMSNENGEIEKISFFDLSVEEQLDILRNQEQDSELDDNEINIINYLRENQLSFDDVINYAKQQGVQEYLANTVLEVKVESMSDDEVFLSDLLMKIPDITDEEAQQALDIEKQNEVLYNKKVQALRQDLLDKERQKLEDENRISQKDKEDSFNEFKNQLIDIAPTIKEIGGRIELDESDLEETVEFLLSEDATGTRYIAKALNDPESLMKMAWFYIKGEEAINTMAEYYEDQIKDYAQRNYNQGYEDATKGKQPEKGTKVVQKPNQNQGNISQYFGVPKNPALINNK